MLAGRFHLLNTHYIHQAQMQEFFVANTRVDISRNQIIREGEIITLEPKVLEVLRVLAKHQGEVVSHQTLLDSVWPDIVVAPNALQRCIGQLRKAFNDDGKTQRVIATHPKRGYSLLAPVTLRTQKSATPKLRWPSAALLALLAVLTMWGAVHLLNGADTASNSSLPLLTRLSPLTATDASEFYSTFSPDGHYVAFSRHVDGVLNHIWLLDRDTGAERRLTAEPGHYGKPNWSTDGKHIAFLQMNSCSEDCFASRCAVVKYLFIPLALSQPQPAKAITDCGTIPLLGVEWISDRLIAVISNHDTHSEILRFNTQTGERKSLYKTSEASLYSLSFSLANQLLAVMQQHHQQPPSMFLLSTHDLKIRQQVFTPPLRYSKSVRWSPVWDHLGEHFLFSAGPFLYSMDRQGNLHSQRVPTFEDISYPMFHPNGESIAMTLGKIDRDVAELQRKQTDNTVEGDDYIEVVFARSILRENDAQYQPNGNKRAFFSRRSGQRQVWLEQDGETFQLSDFDDRFPVSFVWSANGLQIAVSTEHALHLFDLAGNSEKVVVPFAITQVYQWLSDNRLLMQIVDQGEAKLVTYDMGQNRYQTVLNTQSQWAQANQHSVWFIDENTRLLQFAKGTATVIDQVPLLHTGSRFFLRNDHLFIQSRDDHIWQMNLESNALTRLFQYPDTTMKLTDVSADGQHMLISKQLSAKKEIVLLTP